VTLRPSLILVAFKLALHASLITRHGYHRDELYFIACGQRLAFGYVDHAPLVPWIAALAGWLEHHLVALRLPSVLASAGTVVLTVLLTRAWGGGTRAQWIAGMCIVAAPAFLRMSSILCIPVFEPLIWTAAALVVTRILDEGSPKLWLGLGALAGLGLLAKHTMLFWGLGFAVGCLLTPALRLHLRTRWPWLGALLALILFAPNVVWQATNGWATLEFFEAISRSTLARIPRALYLAGQLLFMNPVAVPIWAAGLVFLFSAAGKKFRVFGWLFVTVLVVQVMFRSKPYYLAPAYPALFAAGGMLIERASARRPWLTPLTLGAQAAGFAVMALVALPLLPLPWVDAGLQRTLGWVVRPIDLTLELHDEYGWKEQAEVIERSFVRARTAGEAPTVILAGNYGQAGAVEFFAAGRGLPPVTSGHMSYALWGPAARAPEVVIAYGLPRETLDAMFDDVAVVDRIDHPLAHPWERDLPVYLCRRPKKTLAEVWPSLRRFGHSELRSGRDLSAPRE
jgi:hypothetical protein